MRIIILPALNGDCILVEIQPSHYILIDGGYVDTYENYLLPTLEEIAARGGELDIVVVTHIDYDHISGIIRMMEDMPIRIKEIWYNGYRHIQSVAVTAAEKETFIHRNICKEYRAEKAKPISAKQGCTLSALIARNGIPWNTSAKGYTIMAPMTSPLGDAIIHVLSPNNKNIEALESFWKKRLIKDGLLKKAHSEEFWDDAYEFSLSKDMPGFHFHEKKISKSYDLLKLCEEAYEPDCSASNGSSISFVLETKRKRLLFLGDSHSETVVASLRALYGEEKAPYIFDAVKLSHHGSYNNNSPELFSLIVSDKWLISTNGDKYNHPDMPTLAHIITSGVNNQLYFNYPLPVCQELLKPDYHEGHDFDVIMPEGDKGITITI